MVVKLVPVGMNDYNANMLHEIVENYLYTNWSDTDPVPRSQIKFSYKMDQNVQAGAKNALKCEDGGKAADNEPAYLGDQAFIEVPLVFVTIETRAINNFVNDVPLELFKMDNKVKDIINLNRTGLRPYAAMITYVNAEPAEQDPDASYIWRIKIILRLKQILERKDVP